MRRQILRGRERRRVRRRASWLRVRRGEASPEEGGGGVAGGERQRRRGVSSVCGEAKMSRVNGYSGTTATALGPPNRDDSKAVDRLAASQLPAHVQV
ncbi:hypothetical protein ABZP36_013040 [Zizania latifolia]